MQSKSKVWDIIERFSASICAYQSKRQKETKDKVIDMCQQIWDKHRAGIQQCTDLDDDNWGRDERDRM